MITNNSFNDLPEDAKTDREMAALVTDFYKDSDSYHASYFESMREYFGFYDGSRQWFEKNAQGEWVDIKKVLNQQGKLALTQNMIFPMVNIVQGIQNDSRLSLKAIPRSQEDTAVADAMSEILRWMWDGSKVDRLLSQAFESGNICGRGWMGIEQVDDDLDIFRTKTIFSNVDAGEIRYDQKGRAYDLGDCDYLIRSRVLSRSLAKIVWDKKAYELSQFYSQLDSNYQSTRMDTQWAAYRRSVEILECWYRVYELRTLLFDPNQGQVHDITDLPEEEMGAMLQMYPDVKVMRRKRQVMKFARVAGSNNGVFLDGGASPYEDNYFPYVPYFAYHTRDIDFGIVHNIMDAQREINKRDTQVLHFINQLPKTRVITDNQEDADMFEQGHDITVLKGNFKILDPPQFPLAYAKASETSERKMKVIANLPDDIRGVRGGSDSGVVVDIRRQQAMGGIASLFDNLQWTSENMAMVMASRIRQFMSPEHIARVLGQEKANPEVIQAMKTMTVETYDYAITQSPSSPTLRAENWAKIKDLMTIMPLPPEVVIEASDIVQKDAVLADFEAKKQAMEQQQKGINPGALPPSNTGALPVKAIGE